MPRPAHLNRLRSGARALAALAAALVVVVALAGPARGVAAEEPSLEYQVKAAFLVKLAMFVEWPPESFATPTAPLRIGILGDDPFGPQFDEAVRREHVNGHAVEVRRAREVAGLSGCQVIFINAAEIARLDGIQRELGHRPVLTVGDHPRFARAGGMVNFIKEDGRVRFEVNRGAAEHAGLRLSAKFLQVARVLDPQTLGERTAE